MLIPQQLESWIRSVPDERWPDPVFEAAVLWCEDWILEQSAPTWHVCQLLPQLPVAGTVFLDLGCGTGYLLSIANRLGCKIACCASS